MIKTSYLFAIGLVLASVQTSAAEIIFDRPSGTEKTYDLTTQQIYSGETYNFSGVLSTVIFDGDDVWFENPVTAFGFGSWIKGERQGNTIRIKNGQMIYHQDAGDGYPELDVCVVSGTYTNEIPWSDGKEYAELSIMNDGTIVMPEGKMLLATDQYGGILASNNGYFFQPVDLETAIITPPAGLVSEKYCLHYRQAVYDEDIYRPVELIKDGNTFYIKGLCGKYAPEGWSRGQRNGDYVDFASGQLQGVFQNTFLNYMYGGRVDPRGSLEGYEPERSLKFSYSSATGILSSTAAILETIGDRILAESYLYPELKPYTPGEAIPAKPELRGYTEYPDFTVVSFNIPPLDQSGNYIDPKGITWRLIIDGKPYIFNTEIFKFLPENKEYFAWGECDGEKGIDIVFEACGLYTLWLYEDFSTMAVECTFTHEGKSHSTTSDTMYVREAGINTPEVSAEAQEKAAYTLSGIRASESAHGVVITTEKTPDGKIKVQKTFRRGLK